MSLTIGGAHTVVGNNLYKRLEDSSFSNGRDDKFNGLAGSSPDPGKRWETSQESFVDTTDYLAETRPFLVPIGREGVLKALETLDQQLTASGRVGLLSKMSPTDWTGREIHPGQMGLVNHGGSPELVIKPGRYPGFPLRNWWARSWRRTVGLSDTVIEFLGLTIIQVSQNQAAVISDPQNRVFVLKNGGFVAYAMEGTYDVLSIVDQTHLPNIVRDPLTKITLGSTHEVKMRSRVGSGQQDYVVATFLDLPASNCAILQKGNDLELLGAGQSVITNPNVTVRGLLTLGENQAELPTKDIFTLDQIPVSLTIYLKWQLTEPLKLTTHGYNSPYDALKDKTQFTLTQIVAHLDYSALVKRRSLGADHMNDETDLFRDALRTRAMDRMHEVALTYGIVLKDLAVVLKERPL